MKEVKIGTTRFTKVFAMDEPGQGGACHEYIVETKMSQQVVGRVSFQNGPVKEHGINGCHHEDLIAIVIDRLQAFQAGEFACRENALAITKLEEAMHWLNHRTNARIARGVDGTDKK
jgi:hypothetical protein